MSCGWPFGPGVAGGAACDFKCGSGAGDGGLGEVIGETDAGEGRRLRFETRAPAGSGTDRRTAMTGMALPSERDIGVGGPMTQHRRGQDEHGSATGAQATQMAEAIH